MKKIDFLLLAVVMAIAMTSCDNSPVPVPPGDDANEPKEITFTAQISSTRVADDEFEDGDNISIYGYTEECFLDNECFVYADDIFSGKTPIYWPEDVTSTALFFAIYPYNKSGYKLDKEYVKLSVKTNQDKAASYNASDFMVAYAFGAPSSDATDLEFERLNAQLVVKIENNLDAKVESVTLANVFDCVYASFDLYEEQDWDSLYAVTDALSYDTEAEADAEIAAYASGENVWAMILPVQTIDNGVFTIALDSGEDYTIKMDNKLALKSGESYATTLTLGTADDGGSDDGGSDDGGTDDGGSDDGGTDDGGSDGGGTDDGGSDDGGSDDGGSDDGGTDDGGSDTDNTITLEWTIGDWVDGGNLDYTQES